MLYKQIPKRSPVPHARSLEVATASSQLVKSWTLWTIQNVPQLCKRTEVIARTAAPCPKLERQTGGCWESQLKAAETATEPRAGRETGAVIDKWLEAQWRQDPKFRSPEGPKHRRDPTLSWVLFFVLVLFFVCLFIVQRTSARFSP